MRELLSTELLQELLKVEGRYIQWEWNLHTLQDDYITLREAGGEPAIQRDDLGSGLITADRI